MFLYENRWGDSTISFPRESSHRFVQNGTPRDADAVVRVAHAGAPGIAVADITFHRGERIGRLLRRFDVAGEVFIPHTPPHSRAAGEGGWLPAEGSDLYDLWRWLSARGGFEILYPEQHKFDLNMALDGPDLAPDNRIQVTIGGVVLAEVSSA